MNMQTLGLCCVFSERTGVTSGLIIASLQITVLQLSALLKQADSSKRKLTLTRLASAPVPFTVLSLTGNPCKEDYLAVCGLKVKSWSCLDYLEPWGRDTSLCTSFSAFLSGFQIASLPALETHRCDLSHSLHEGRDC